MVLPATHRSLSQRLAIAVWHLTLGKLLLEKTGDSSEYAGLAVPAVILICSVNSFVPSLATQN